MVDPDGFILVTGKKAAKKTRKPISKDAINFLPAGRSETHSRGPSSNKKEQSESPQPLSPTENERFSSLVASEVIELKNSEYFRKFTASLQVQLQGRQLQTIVCLGLGHFKTCPIARTQFAFLVALQEEYRPEEGTSASDPVFSTIEQAILESWPGLHLLRDNSEGKLLLRPLTLVYLPHCPKQLTNNLLWANWNPSDLKDIFIVCNSFQRLLSHLPQRVLTKEAKFISLASEFVKEIAIENCFKFPDIFNDSALHLFEHLPSLDDWKHWQEIEFEPIYEVEDLEYIQKEDPKTPK